MVAEAGSDPGGKENPDNKSENSPGMGCTLKIGFEEDTPVRWEGENETMHIQVHPHLSGPISFGGRIRH